MASIADLVGDLAARLVPERAGAALDATIAEIVVDNGLADDPPAWFVDLLTAMLDGRTVPRTPFPREALGDHGDVANALAELALLLPLGHDSYGEGIVLHPAPLGMRAFISVEGRGDDATYEVSAVP